MKYFSISELSHSATADFYKIDNSPSPEVIENLNKLVDNVLDPLREKLCMAVYVNCGYRCPEVNTLVGGVKNSEHLFGRAADIWCKDNDKLIAILRTMDFNQMIIYKSFVHISYNEGNNKKQIIVKDTSKKI